MGNSQSTVSKEGEGHPELFYTAVKAAKEGRFTVSEVYFIQVLKEHPGAAFWGSVMSAVTQTPGKVDVSNAVSPREQESEKNVHIGTEAVKPLDLGRAPQQRTGAFNTEGAASATAAAAENTAGGSEDLEKADTKTDTTASLLTTKIVDVHLPLNGNLFPVMDYVRLFADISLTYLRLLPTNANSEKVSGLAARYCLFAVSHTQTLLHCLALWKEEKFGDGGGFIDYEKKRHLRFGERDAVGGISSEVEVDEGERSAGGSSAGGQKWRRMDRTSSLLFTLALLESRLRYYHSSCLVNYCALLLRAAATSKEGRKQNAVLQNALEQVEAVFVSVSDLAKEYPDEYISKLVLQHIPQSASERRDLLSSTGNSSHRSDHHSLGVGSDVHRWLFASGAPWAPTQSGLISLITTRSVRLSVQEAVSRATQAQICSPAQRLSYHYTGWNYPTELIVLSGCSLFLLTRSLPGFVPGKHTLAHQTLLEQDRSESVASASVTAAPHPVEVQQSTPADVDVKATAAMRQNAAKEAAKRDAAVKKMEARLSRRRRTVNADLDLCDERTCVVLCLEEAAVVALPAVFLLAVLQKTSGEMEEAVESLHRLKAMAVGLHGPASAEWVLIAEIVRSVFGDNWE